MAGSKKASVKVAAGRPRKTTALAISRPPGRPPASETKRASRASCFRAGWELTKSVPLQDLSIVCLARSMDITPALVHYYVGSRDHLTSGIMNLFYKGTVKNWPAQTGDWQHDVVNAAEHLYMHLLAYPGIAAYLDWKSVVIGKSGAVRVDTS